MFTQFKIYFYGAALIAILGFVWDYKRLNSKVDMQKTLIEKQRSVLKLKDELIENNLQQQIKDNSESISHLQKIEEYENETTLLRAAVAAKPSILRIKATCPKLPNTEPNTAGATEVTPQLTEDARQGYIDLTEQIKEINLLYERAMKRVREDYENCGNKLEQVK